MLFGLLVSASNSHSEEAAPSFSITLIQPAISCAEARSLSLPELDTGAGVPFVTTASVRTYDWEDHTIDVDKELLPRKWHWLFSVEGRVFLVKVGSEPIYAGALITGFSSSSCSLPVVVWPRWGVEAETEKSVFLRLSLGYPTTDYFEGTDPRSDARILRTLEEAGRIHSVHHSAASDDLNMAVDSAQPSHSRRPPQSSAIDSILPRPHLPAGIVDYHSGTAERHVGSLKDSEGQD